MLTDVTVGAETGGVEVGVAVTVEVGVGMGDTFIVPGGGVTVGATVGDCVGHVCDGAVTVRGRVSVEVCEEFEVCA